jgi:hypothetical protein
MLDIRQIAEFAKKYAETLKAALADKLALQQANLELMQADIKAQEQILALRAELAKLSQEDADEDANFQLEIDKAVARATTAEKALASAAEEKASAEADLDKALVEIQGSIDAEEVE